MANICKTDFFDAAKKFGIDTSQAKSLFDELEDLSSQKAQANNDDIENQYEPSFNEVSEYNMQCLEDLDKDAEGITLYGDIKT